MKNLELSALTEPLSVEAPCGPDLEAADDDDYLNAIVTAETVLPPEFFVYSDYINARQPFDQDRRYSGLDLGAQIETVAAFTGRTHDIRLDVLLTKLFVLAKNLVAAELCVRAIAILLEEQWDAVHPRIEGGSDAIRREVLQRLDDALIVTALQHIPLFRSRNQGAITWHRYSVEMRKGADGDELPEFDRALADEGQTDLSVLTASRDELAQVRGTLDSFVQSLRRIRAACVEGMADGPPNLQALTQVLERQSRLTDRVYRLVEAAVVRIDPAAAREPAPALAADEPSNEVAGPGAAIPPSAPTPGLTTIAEATAALAAATGYFERAEPSNPALLLLRQAQALIGKSFLEAMQVLLPDHAAKAIVEVGAGKTFGLPLARLAADATEAVAGGALAADPAAPWPLAANRAAAVALLDQVGAFFRSAEPSSPIPMLTDGARGLTGKDFMTLLADLLPKDTLKAAGAK